MNNSQDYKPVNWVNGMKINKSHFITQYYATIYQQALSNTAFLNDHNYGLMPDLGKATLPKIWLSLDNMQHVNIKIMSCTAITRGGHIIRFQSDNIDKNNNLVVKIPGLSVPFKELQGNNETYYIVISIDPYNPVPSGAANPEEQPIRLPHTDPSYAISLLPINGANVNNLGGFQLPIGKVAIKDQTVTLVDDYLPPCTTANSHPDLLQHHAETEQFLGKMELNVLQILQKILQKNQQNVLIEPIKKLCENILVYISTVSDEYRHNAHYNPPLQLVIIISGLARTTKNAIDIFVGTIKDEMINYFTEWCNVKQGELEDEITSVCNYKYNHLNIREAIEMNIRFSALILQLFSNLAGLDYIGKKKETGIFVKEQLILPEQEMQTKKRGFFLAD